MAGVGDDFEAFFRSEVVAVVATVHHIVGDRGTAEEIAQEAFFRAAMRWRRLRSYDKPGAWVRRVAIRDAVRASRRRARLDHRPTLELVVDGTGPSDAVDSLLATDALWQAVHQLPGQQRAAVVLYYLEDRPSAEVADLLACREPTVRSHLRAARRRLAELLGDHDERLLRDA